jgi:serine/threonine-protein kinase HipA
MSATSGYKPSDKLWLWWLASPSRPTLVGELNFVHSLRSVSLRYADTWVSSGFPLSEDLPLLLGHEFLPGVRDVAVGAVDDARPDRWGERIIRFVDRPARLSLMEYLYFAGDDRFGALGVSSAEDRYEPRRLGPLPQLGDMQTLFELVRQVLNNEPIQESLKRLISPGVTLGGARPKALLEAEGQQWVVKFADGDSVDTPLVEHASMTLSQHAGIRAARTFPIRLTYGHAVAIQRFDRTAQGRIHALSAKVVLAAAGSEYGYPELAQVLRRRGIVEGGVHTAQMHELFRRMVFNILIDNTDDHEKNHAILINDAGQYTLSPAYDVLPSGQALGYQQMRVGSEGASATLENALSMCSQFGLKRAQAVAQCRRVSQALTGWKDHFRASGVSPNDIELLGEQLDRPFLLDQRAAFA